jgi:hypothetical protein
MDNFGNTLCTKTLNTVQDCVSILKLKPINVCKKWEDTKLKKGKVIVQYLVMFLFQSGVTKNCHLGSHITIMTLELLESEAKKYSDPFECWITISTWLRLTLETNCCVLIGLKKAYVQIGYEAFLQTFEYLIFECHANIQE